MFATDFEYLLISEDREGEEWTLGSAWVLPSARLEADEDVEAAVKRITSQVPHALFIDKKSCGAHALLIENK